MFLLSPNFLKWLWSFLRESVFKNEAFLTWARSNVRLCIWISMWIINVLAMIQMTYMLSHTLDENRALQKHVDSLETKKTENTAALQFSVEMTQALSQELNWTRHWVMTHPCPPVPTPAVKKEPRIRTKTLIETLQSWDKAHPPGNNTEVPLLPYPHSKTPKKHR